MTLTTIEFLGQLSIEAYSRAKKYENNCKTRQEASEVDMKSYEQGKSMAYMDAQKIVQQELRRLRNLWQNNMLTYDSFQAGW